MKLYYVKNARVWLVLRLVALFSALVVAMIYIPWIMFWVIVTYLIVDLVLYWYRYGFKMDKYFHNALGSWLTLIEGKTFGKFVIGLSEDTIKTQHSSHSISDIKSFHKAHGGSEPYLLLKDGGRVDLDMSWLDKADRIEIQERLEQLIRT